MYLVIEKPESYCKNGFNRYAYCLNNPLKYTDPNGELVIQLLVMLANMYINTSVANNFEFNPSKWNWRSPVTYSSLLQSGYSGWQMGAKAENWVNKIKNRKYFDQLSNRIVNDYNSRFEIPENYTYAEGYTASLGGGNSPQTQWLSLGAGEPTISYDWHKTPIVINYPNGGDQLQVQVYGRDIYSDYNWIQTASYQGSDLFSDPIGRPNNGLYYSTQQQKELALWYKQPLASSFFEDNPNATFFNADLTLCGKSSAGWESIKTFSWGFSLNKQGNFDSYFRINHFPSLTHVNNIISILNNFNPFIF